MRIPESVINSQDSGNSVEFLFLIAPEKHSAFFMTWDAIIKEERWPRYEPSSFTAPVPLSLLIV